MNVFQKLIAKIVKKSVSDIVSNPEVVSNVLPSDEGKRNIWKFVIQTLISILRLSSPRWGLPAAWVSTNRFGRFRA